MCNCAGFSGYSNCNGCSQFTGNRPPEITADEFSGNRPSYITADFVGDDSSSFDGDSEVYDTFLTQKQRERRKQIKQGMASGLSRADARKQALASVPKTKLAEIMQKIRNGEPINVVQTKLGDVKIDPKVKETLDELSDAIKTETDANGDIIPEPTFFEKNKTYIIGGAVLVAGIFVYMKFIKK